MNPPSERRKRYWPLPVLLVLFAGPLLLAWWLRDHVDPALFGSANHGRLVEPPVILKDVPLFEPARPGEGARLHGKWSLLYFATERCDAPCGRQIHRMRQLRLALGKEAYRVQRVLLLLAGPVIDARLLALLRDYPGQLLWTPPAGERDGLLSQFPWGGQLYLVDPQGMLVLAYASDADPKGIVRDLERLLRASWIG